MKKFVSSITGLLLCVTAFAITGQQAKVAKLVGLELKEKDSIKFRRMSCSSNRELHAMLPKNYVFDKETSYEEIMKSPSDHVFVMIRLTDKSNYEPNITGTMVDRNPRGYVVLAKQGKTLCIKSYNLDCFYSENEDGGAYFAPELGYYETNGILHIHYSHGRYGFWWYEFKYENGDYTLIKSFIDESASWITETLTSTEIDLEEGTYLKSEMTNAEEVSDYEYAAEKNPKAKVVRPIYETTTDSIHLDVPIMMSEIETIY